MAAAPPELKVTSDIPANPLGAYWHHTMIRIKDPKVTVPFFENHFGFTLMDTYTFPGMKFSLYFMAIVPPDMKDKVPKAGTPEAAKFLWSNNITYIELCHNHGAEDDDKLTYNNGNVEPHRGFGHIAVACDDVYKSSDALLAKGVKFQKKPNEGRMKGLAFALDPQGYWIEIVKRSANTGFKPEYNLAQTMLRVKDPVKSVNFYREHFGMTLIRAKHFEQAKFSLYFLACLNKDDYKQGLPAPDTPEAYEFTNGLWSPVLELTHNHGTEKDDSFSYHNGNDQPQGFGHVAFIVDDIDASVKALKAKDVTFKKEPNTGKMKGIAFALDPDGYWVELIPRGYQLDPALLK